jgi:hypothetical protein
MKTTIVVDCPKFFQQILDFQESTKDYYGTISKISIKGGLTLIEFNFKSERAIFNYSFLLGKITSKHEAITTISNFN